MSKEVLEAGEKYMAALVAFHAHVMRDYPYSEVMSLDLAVRWARNELASAIKQEEGK